MPTGGEQILEAAAQRRGIRYQMPPDPSGTANLDCSLFIVLTYRDAGFAIPGGARTAEQIRQACSPIDRSEMEAGDLLFFENTYQASGPPGPDGKVASHVGDDRYPLRPAGGRVGPVRMRGRMVEFQGGQTA
jgi:cell wall-associated NlpC family hydrolase